MSLVQDIGSERAMELVHGIQDLIDTVYESTIYKMKRAALALACKESSCTPSVHTCKLQAMFTLERFRLFERACFAVPASAMAEGACQERQE